VEEFDQSDQAVHGSWGLLILAAAAVAASFALWTIGDLLLSPTPRHLVGWAAASLFGFTCVVGHRRAIESLRHDEPSFVLDPAQLRFGTVLLWAGVVMAGVHSWYFATELAA
jgi:predicted permease